MHQKLYIRNSVLAIQMNTDWSVLDIHLQEKRSSFLLDLTTIFKSEKLLSNQGPGQQWANETMKADVSLPSVG